MRPLITITTDFGLSDHYVAAMKGVLLSRVPAAQLVDVTQMVPRHDVLAGAFALERAVATFPPGAVHLAVVDPGVGSDRRVLVARVREQWVVCPDNGLITWAWRRHGVGRCWQLTWRPGGEVSDVFHGRDLMSPVAGMLAAGANVEALGRPIDDPVLLAVTPATGPAGVVIYMDGFGNCTTNVPAQLLPASARVLANGRAVGPVRRTYSEVKAGEVLALVGSSGLLEVAVNQGSAARVLGLRVGDPVVAEGP